MELSAPCLGLLALQRLILFLGKNSPLIFVVFIIWRILRTFTVLQVAFEGLQRSLRFLLDPRQWFPKTESVQQKSKSSLQDTKTVKKGTTEDAARRTPSQRLRQRLRQDQACQVCRRAAQEPEQLVYYQRTDAGRCAKPRFLLSPGPCRESQFSTATSVEEEQESSLWTSSVTSTHVGSIYIGTEGTAVSTETSQYGARVPARQKASKPTAQDRKTRDSSCEKELDVSIEDFSNWSSSTHETSSVSSWTDSSSHSTLIFSRLKSCRSCKHHRSVLQKQKSSRGSAKQASLEATKVEEMLLPPVPVSFMKEPMIDSLDSHWVVKRLQHLLGMSWILLGSLRSFMTSSPESSLGKAPGPTVLVRRPRLLAFVDAKTRKKLELHLKKRVHLKHWQLPRRVQEALRHMKPPPVPKSETSLVQKSGREATRSGVPGPSSYQRLLDVVKMKVKLHLAQKCIEIQTEVFPELVLHSWRHSTWLAKQSLPRLVSRADKPLEAHLAFLPSMLPQDAKKMELAEQRQHLSSCWDLGKRYIGSLAAAAPPPSSSKPLLGRKAACEFSAAQTPFLQPWGREALEAHMRQKRLQHEWGLPSVVRRSLKAFLPSVAPWGSTLRKAESHIETPPRKLGFLPGYICSLLEFHLQRMKLQQRWGLPRRVLETYQWLFPEFAYKGKRGAVKPFSQRPSLGVRPLPGCPKQEEEKSRKIQPVLVLKTKILKKLEVHLTKKHLEVGLETFPAVLRFSRRSAWLSTSRPLPKLILPGLKTPQTRRSGLSFDLAAMGRIEVALQRGRLVSLWGLGLKYVETLAAMCPEGLSAKFKEVRFEFSEVKSPFIEKAVKENLEMHVRKKRLQHEWGYSILVQRSLRSFIGEAPQCPFGLQKALTQTSLLHVDLRFLSEQVRQNLELHIQRMKVQRRWGIPQKVHRYVKFFHALVLEEKPQAKLGLGETQTDSVRRKDGNALLPKNEGCLEDLLRSTLETHLKKKSLEINFQLTGYEMSSGPIKRVFLPKRSSVSLEIKPRTSGLCFVEQDVVEKINLNIKRKHLMHLWGLPSIYAKSLSMMFGNVMAGSPPLEMSKLRRWAVEKNIGQESPTRGSMVSRTKELRRKCPCFVRTEILDLLEMHVRCKKLQHEWGLPSMVQKSLRGFAAPSLEPKRLLKGIAIATPSSRGALEVTIKITKSLFFLDLATQKLLEAHLKTRTAAHRWGLPKRVQKSLKMFLPPASSSQVEGDRGQAETPRHAYNRLFQTSTKQWPKAEKVHRVIPVKRPLPEADLLLGEMSRDKISRSGRGKMMPGRGTAPIFLKLEDLEFMGLHIRHKRIQHEWGLPTLVQRSLKAFAPVPPEPQKKPLTGLARERVEDGRKASRVVHVPRPTIRVLVPHQCFLSRGAKARLEYHVSRRTRQHKWGLPQRIRDSLRAIIPPPQVPDEKTQPEHRLGFHLQEGVHASLSRREQPPWGTSSWKEATIKPMKSIHHPRKPDARPSSRGTFETMRFLCPKMMLSFLPVEKRHLLEFHIQRKKIQHAWGLPSTVLRSLRVFAPYLIKPEKATGKTTSRKPRRETRGVQIFTQDLNFLSLEVKERLEAHLRHRTSEHRWGLPERVRRSLRAFLPRRPPPRPGITGFHPLLPLLPKPLQTTEDIYEPVMFKPEPKQKTLQKQNVDNKRHRATHRSRQTKAQICSGTKTGLSFLPEGIWNLLEFHIQWKRIQHAWGLPSTVLQSLHAFAPQLLKAKKCGTRMMAKVPPCDGGEVQILRQDLDFLSVEEEERLEAHLRHLMSERRWGLPERVQRSLRSFLPPRFPSRSEVTGPLPFSPYPATDTYVQPSWTPEGTEDLQILPPSSPSSYVPRNYVSNVGKPERRVSFQNVKLGSGRATPRVKNKTPLPGFKAKMASSEKEDSSEGVSLEGLTPPPKPSAAGRELKSSPKIRSCLSCRPPAPKETSTASSSSDRQPKWPEKKKRKKKVNWANGEDDSSPLAEDNEAQDSLSSSGDIMDEPAESSGDGTSRSSLQEPEAANMYGRPWDLRPYHAPISQRVSYFFPQHVHVPYSSYEDVVARRYRQVRRREHHAMQSSKLHWRRSRLVWREVLGHPLAGATRCQAFCQTQMVERWSSECEMFLCLQCPSSSRGTRSSTGDQEVQPPNRSRNQDFVRTDVKVQVYHESCSVTLKAESKEDERRERVTLAVAKEQSLLTLETRSQGSPEGEDRRVDDWDQGRKLEVEREDRNQGTEESLREERGSWRRANSSAVGDPPNLAEDASLPLVAPMEDPSNQVCSTVAEAVVESPDDRDVIKPGEIADSKDLVFWQKRQAPGDLTQLEAMGQGGVAQRPLPRGMRPIGGSPGRPSGARKSKQVTVSWSRQETRQERLVARRLASDPKLGQGLEAPRQGVRKTPQGQRSLERERMALLGEILEKKLNLQQGLVIWRQNLAQKEMEERGRKREKREAGGGGDGGRQRGRPPQPSSASVDKQPRALSTLHRCMDLLKEKLCFWKRSPKKTAGLPKKPGERGNPTGSAEKNQAAQ